MRTFWSCCTRPRAVVLTGMLVVPLVGVVVLTVSGCSGRVGPTVEFVEGVVTLDGVPVGGASVG